MSLIAFDGSRDVYVFDLYDDRNFTASSKTLQALCSYQERLMAKGVPAEAIATLPRS